MTNNPSEPVTRWKIVAITGILALLIVCGVLAMQLFEKSINDDNLADGLERREKALGVLRALMPAVSQLQHNPSFDEVLAILRKQNPAAPIATGSDTIDMDELRFHFGANGTLDRIDRTNDYATKRTDPPVGRDALPR